LLLVLEPPPSRPICDGVAKNTARVCHPLTPFTTPFRVFGCFFRLRSLLPTLSRRNLELPFRSFKHAIAVELYFRRLSLLIENRRPMRARFAPYLSPFISEFLLSAGGFAQFPPLSVQVFGMRAVLDQEARRTFYMRRWYLVFFPPLRPLPFGFRSNGFLGHFLSSPLQLIEPSAAPFRYRSCSGVLYSSFEGGLRVRLCKRAPVVLFSLDLSSKTSRTVTPLPFFRPHFSFFVPAFLFGARFLAGVVTRQ